MCYNVNIIDSGAWTADGGAQVPMYSYATAHACITTITCITFTPQIKGATQATFCNVAQLVTVWATSGWVIQVVNDTNTRMSNTLVSSTF